MHAAMLLSTLRARGVRLEADGDQLRYKFPQDLSDALGVRQAITARKHELLAVLADEGHGAPISSKKTDETADLASLVAWFQEVDADHRLPRDPFVLHAWAKVADPSRFYAALRGDIAAGPSSFRARTGALLDDLKALRRVVEGDTP